MTGAGSVARRLPVLASVNVTDPSLFALAFSPLALTGSV